MAAFRLLLLTSDFNAKRNFAYHCDEGGAFA